MSPRHLEDVLKTCLEDISWRLLQDGFSVTIFRLPRHLQDILWDVFKTSLKRVRRWKIVTLKMCWRRLPGMSWRRLQDIFKTNKCLLGCIWNILMIFLVCMHFFSPKMVHEYVYVRKWTDSSHCTNFDLLEVFRIE